MKYVAVWTMLCCASLSGLSQSAPLAPPAQRPVANEPAMLPPEAAGGPSEIKPMHIGGSVLPPKLISSVRPEFSEDAKRNKIYGTVQVYLWVDQKGMPRHVSVTKSLRHGLDEEAVAAVRKYRFSPATQNGRPVTVDLYVNVNFER